MTLLTRLIHMSAAIFSISVFATGAVYAAEFEESIVKFERVNEISVDDFWTLASAKVVASKVNAIIVYWPFDYDSIAKVDGWRLIGIIGAGLFDLGETPVVAMVYARDDVYFLADESETKTKQLWNSATAVFGISPNLCRREPSEHCGERVTFSIDANNVVLGDGHEIGVVED